ncbi:putative ribonuclease H-like domain-containing protein [Tanacetum coccineum]
MRACCVSISPKSILAIYLALCPRAQIVSLDFLVANEIIWDCQGGNCPCEVGLGWDGDGYVFGEMAQMALHFVCCYCTNGPLWCHNFEDLAVLVLKGVKWHCKVSPWRTNDGTYQLQKVWTLVDLPKGKRAIRTKWVYKNKKDERGIVVRNKARLVAQGYTKEEGINYDEVFALVARIEAIRLFLAFMSFMGFIVYQMDLKSAFLYGTIKEEVYVCQPPGFEDPQFPDKVYKVEITLYGLHQALRAWYETLSTYLLENGFRRGIIDKTLFIKKDKGDILLVQVMQRDNGIFISQDKYMADILKKFDFVTMKTASTPIETHKALIKDEEAEDVDVHLYRSMIRSLMYLTASRPNIMFTVCACARDSPFDLEAFSDSDYAGASLDGKSTTGGVIDPKSNA